MSQRGAFRGNKRQKELKRLQKQEDKRQKRFQKKLGLPAGTEGTGEELLEGTAVPAEEPDAAVHEPAPPPEAPPEPGKPPET